MGLKFDGIDLKATYGFTVVWVAGRGSPPVEHLTFSANEAHIPLATRYLPRTITVEGFVYGSNAAANKDALLKLLGSAKSVDKPLTFPDTNKTFYVRLAEDPIAIEYYGPPFNSKAYKLTLTFIAFDPHAYKETERYGLQDILVTPEVDQYLIAPSYIRELLPHEPKALIEGYTIVNMLGGYGDFEADSNSDGVADGWTKLSTTLQCSIRANSSTAYETFLGNKCQRLYVPQTTNESGSPIRAQISITLELRQNQTYFFSVYARKTAGKAAATITADLSGQSGIFSLTPTSDSWQRLSATFNSGSGTSITIYAGWYIPSGQTQPEGETFIDGMMLVMLDESNDVRLLPSRLMKYLGVSSWRNLATTNNITAADGKTLTGIQWLEWLLPFGNGIYGAHGVM